MNSACATRVAPRLARGRDLVRPLAQRCLHLPTDHVRELARNLPACGPVSRRGRAPGYRRLTSAAASTTTGRRDEVVVDRPPKCDPIQRSCVSAANAVFAARSSTTRMYGKPVVNILNGRGTLLLVNVPHIKQVTGHKTDVADQELGGNYYDRLQPERLARHLVHRREQLGHKVTWEDRPTVEPAKQPGSFSESHRSHTAPSLPARTRTLGRAPLCFGCGCGMHARSRREESSVCC